MFKIVFHDKQGSTVELEQEHEQRLLHVIKRAGLSLTHRCGGHARCGTCRVRVVEGEANLSERGSTEARILDILKAAPEERLACQTWVRGDVTIHLT